MGAGAGAGHSGEMTHAQITHEVYEKLIEKTLMQPTFVTRLPAELVPLAKRCEDDPSVGGRVRAGDARPGDVPGLHRAERSARPARAPRGAGRRATPPRSTRISCARSSTACRRPAAWASASTAWSWS